MKIIAFFEKDNIPQETLSPVIRILDLSDDSIVINDATMLHVNGGIYQYDFSTYDPEKDYAIRCDGTSSMDDYGRYSYGGNEEPITKRPTIKFSS